MSAAPLKRLNNDAVGLAAVEISALE